MSWDKVGGGRRRKSAEGEARPSMVEGSLCEIEASKIDCVVLCLETMPMRFVLSLKSYVIGYFL